MIARVTFIFLIVTSPVEATSVPLTACIGPDGVHCLGRSCSWKTLGSADGNPKQSFSVEGSFRIT